MEYSVTYKVHFSAEEKAEVVNWLRQFRTILFDACNEYRDFHDGTEMTEILEDYVFSADLLLDDVDDDIWEDDWSPESCDARVSGIYDELIMEIRDFDNEPEPIRSWADRLTQNVEHFMTNYNKAIGFQAEETMVCAAPRTETTREENVYTDLISGLCHSMTMNRADIDASFYDYKIGHEMIDSQPVLTVEIWLNWRDGEERNDLICSATVRTMADLLPLMEQASKEYRYDD